MIATLEEVKNQGRFKVFGTAVYARWAEMDPETAWVRLADERRFPSEAIKGILIKVSPEDLDGLFGCADLLVSGVFGEVDQELMIGEGYSRIRG